MTVKVLSRCLCAAIVCIPTTAFAQEVSLELEAGTFYDSQLVVEDVDLQQSEGDFGFRLGADLEVTAVDTESVDLELGYRFGQTLYSDFSQFDLQSHVGDVRVTTRVAGARLGLRYAYSDFNLGGDGLLSSHTLTPSVSGFVSDGLYVRGFYTYSDKDFDTSDGRDAELHQLGLSAFKFYADNAGFFSLRGHYEEEEAFDPQFSFDGFNLTAEVRVPLGTRDDPHFDVSASYRSRDYDGITPSIGEPRDEDRLRGEVEFVFPLNERFWLEADYRYTDRSSNLPTADYVEHRFGLSAFFEL